MELCLDQRNVVLASRAVFIRFPISPVYAASQLDISPDELRVELRPEFRKSETQKQQVFLADNLANGAGYCRHLGEVDDAKGEPFPAD